MKYTTVADCQIAGLAEIYMGVFGDKLDGHFIEIGAYDGVSWSNTFNLADRGWYGVYVEPVERLFRSCVNNHVQHPRISCLNVACMARNGVVEIMTDGIQLYTANDKMAATLNANNVQQSVQALPLDTILRASSMPTGFDLLVIDVEGSEPEVLAGFGVGYWSPRMVIIEAHEHHDNPRLRVNADYINLFFKNAGYLRIYCDSINNIYVRK